MRRPTLSPARAARAVDLFTLAVIASVGIALAGLTWRIIGWAGGDAPLPAPPRSAAAPSATGDGAVAPALAFAPFGAAAAGEAVASTLPIELRGIILAVPAARSVALIAPQGGAGPSVAYAVGAVVPGGGTLDLIAIDHVELAVGGQRQRLNFPRPGAPAAPAPAAGTNPVIAGPPPPPVIAGAAPPGPPPAAAAALTASPQALLDSLGASPVTGGYRIGEGLSPPMRAAGLRPGDTILSLNGQPLGNAASDSQLLAAAARSGTATVQVMRGDSRLTLAFPFR